MNKLIVAILFLIFIPAGSVYATFNEDRKIEWFQFGAVDNNHRSPSRNVSDVLSASDQPAAAQRHRKHEMKERHHKHEMEKRHRRHEMEERHRKHEMEKRHHRHEMEERHRKHEMKERHHQHEIKKHQGTMKVNSSRQKTR
ncbi:MAG: hypothetical protein A3F11_08655 [Gammaproteobacteria bacterium RIFCSPHIGHO2_12_FULL_37_14]|nr:MAG: hypothetical protein A3F11_08655 [Gammaproteobacteria bacterium RIFCSPHIGHO2_12_FULL_37_14]